MKIKQNLWIIVLSVVLSIFFWMQALMLKEHETVVTFPLLVDDIPKNEVNLKNIPSRIEFRVRGLGYEILKLKLNKTAVQIDYHNLVNKMDDLTSSDYSMTIPSNINIDILGPVDIPEAKHQNSDMREYSLPIQIEFANDEARNLFLRSNFSLSINTIIVKSHDDIPDYIKSIRTEPIKPEMLRTDNIKLRLITPSNNLILNNQTVDLIKSSSTYITRVLNNIPVQNPQNITFFPRDVTIRVRGLSQNITNLNFNQVKVSLKTNESNDNEIPLFVTLPAGIELIDYSPKRVFRMDANEPK